MTRNICTSAQLQVQRDRRLAQRMLAGDERALQVFIDDYFPRLYRYAQARLSNPTDAEDVVQVTLTQAARRLETYRGESTLLTWMIQICRHEMARFWKQRARGDDITLPFLNDELLRAVVEAVESDQYPSPEQATWRRELIQLILFSMDNLPEHYALALELKYVEGFNSREIAARLSMTDQATQSLLARARQAFRDVCGEALRSAL